MKITKLTPEQEAQIPGWVKKWVDIGLSTEPADFEAATEAALKAYALCNLKKPMVVLRMGSPYAATVGGALAWQMLRSLRPDQVRAQVRAQVGDQVWATSYWAIKMTFGLPIKHWFFDFLKLGVMVVFVQGKVKVFGKNGKYLGEYDEKDFN